MDVVSLAARDTVSKRITELGLYRYWAVSILYIVAFAITVLAYGSAVISAVFLKGDLSGTRLLTLFGGGTGSGSLGWFLVRVDRAEKENIRYQQDLEILLAMPDANGTWRAILKVITARLNKKDAPEEK